MVVMLASWVFGWLGFLPGLLVGVLVFPAVAFAMIQAVCNRGAEAGDAPAGVPGSPAPPVSAPMSPEQVSVAEAEAERAELEDERGADAGPEPETEPDAAAAPVAGPLGYEDAPGVVEVPEAEEAARHEERREDAAPHPDEAAPDPALGAPVETPEPDFAAPADDADPEEVPEPTSGAGSEGGDLEAELDAPGEADRPPLLEAPRGGQADDLKRIRGIGPKLERVLNEMGIYHFDQIAGWGPRELAWVDDNLQGFRGRASRDRWVEQARAISDPA
ncbi:NADH:ubiquinone oxidoreductase 41 kD complex I subunit [Oceanicola granulosus HTCC2516]|uniref:NADH:ubiquinone oxidoreductase 41 kD complex I subunit n=1 Tax=Oceanicola granulosus (strain ATCC BAA-861 / DSM 15982 / KCTC 12143 / HTCC2516) TaxID=314256 RepID=Q2CIY6_OCEGH|nr:NADH:ubiquinone oxidoreductase 41 kD complex I subunit [Oceanicola granulosus HTCC2516]